MHGKHWFQCLALGKCSIRNYKDERSWSGWVSGCHEWAEEAINNGVLLNDNNWLSEGKKSPEFRVCQLLWCKYSYRDQFCANDITSSNAEQGRDANEGFLQACASGLRISLHTQLTREARAVLPKAWPWVNLDGRSAGMQSKRGEQKGRWTSKMMGFSPLLRTVDATQAWGSHWRLKPWFFTREHSRITLESFLKIPVTGPHPYLWNQLWGLGTYI